MKNNPRIIIVGHLEENDLSGPGEVLKTLFSGLESISINYEFINSNKHKSAIGTLLVFLRITFFTRNAVINTHTFGYKMPYMMLISSKINKSNKHFLTVHGINSYEYKINKRPADYKKLAKIENKLYKKYPNIICVSKFLKKYIENNYDRHNNISYAYNCIKKNNTYSATKKDGFTFLYTGGFNNRKNPLEAIDFFLNTCIKYNSHSKLIICGNRDDKILYKKCLGVINASKHKKSITVLGMLDKETLSSYYDKSTYILAPSIFDTFNMSVLEAMNYGCIPIVSDNCGIKDVINSDNGFILKDDITNKLFKNINKRSLESFNTASRLNPQNMAKEYINIFNGTNNGKI